MASFRSLFVVVRSVIRVFFGFLVLKSSTIFYLLSIRCIEIYYALSLSLYAFSLCFLLLSFNNFWVDQMDLLWSKMLIFFFCKPTWSATWLDDYQFVSM